MRVEAEFVWFARTMRGLTSALSVQGLIVPATLASISSDTDGLPYEISQGDFFLHLLCPLGSFSLPKQVRNSILCPDSSSESYLLTLPFDINTRL